MTKQQLNIAKSVGYGLCGAAAATVLGTPLPIWAIFALLFLVIVFVFAFRDLSKALKEDEEKVEDNIEDAEVVELFYADLLYAGMQRSQILREVIPEYTLRYSTSRATWEALEESPYPVLREEAQQVMILAEMAVESLRKE